MITILGATGNVGSKIANILIKKGKKVRLIARSKEQLKPLLGKSAEAFSGDALDTEFLVKAFKESHAVFTLIPPNLKADNFMSYADKIGESIAWALKIAGVKHVVNLSSVGADLSEGTGLIVGLHNQEERLNKIKGLNVLHLRPTFFMENLLMSTELIRAKGVVGNTIRGDIKFPMIATKDVAVYAAELLINKAFSGFSVRYLLGQRDLSLIEATQIIGMKINKFGLFYIMIPSDEARKGLVAMGLSPDVSKLYIEMNRAISEDCIRYEKRTTENTTPTAFEVFCDEVIVPAYLNKVAA